MSVNGLRCIKDRDLEEEREGREREREALEAVVVALRVFFFFLLSSFTACPTDVQEEVQLLWRERKTWKISCLPH